LYHNFQLRVAGIVYEFYAPSVSCITFLYDLRIVTDVWFVEYPTPKNHRIPDYYCLENQDCVESAMQ